MARYVSLIQFADQGIRNIKDTIKRGDAAIAEAEKMGMKIIEEFWTMGAYDGVVLFDAPNDETMPAFALKVSSLGNVKTHAARFPQGRDGRHSCENQITGCRRPCLPHRSSTQRRVCRADPVMPKLQWRRKLREGGSTLN